MTSTAQTLSFSLSEEEALFVSYGLNMFIEANRELADAALRIGNPEAGDVFLQKAAQAEQLCERLTNAHRAYTLRKPRE